MRKNTQALAGGRALAEWVREVLFRELDGSAGAARRTNVAGGSPGAAHDPAERLSLRACASQERLTPFCILRCYDCDARV